MNRTGLLVLARHGQSTDNEANLFSGWRNPPLTVRGVEEARSAGRKLKDRGYKFDVAFTSVLGRARQSLDLMLGELGQSNVPIVASDALNERSYGDLSGLNKDQARSTWGDERVHRWRKSFDAIPPGGESLAMTMDRMLPFWQMKITPRLMDGEHVLVVAHGNSLRSIVTHLEGYASGAIDHVHIATSEMIVYSAENGGLVRDDVIAP